MIRGLTDVTAVGRIPSLRALFLQALRQVEALPDFSGATSLRRVRLETMKGLRDLRPLATAPALEAVELIDMRHLQPEDLAPLVGLPICKAVTPGLGSRRKNELRPRCSASLPCARPTRGGWRQPGSSWERG